MRRAPAGHRRRLMLRGWSCAAPHIALERRAFSSGKTIRQAVEAAKKLRICNNSPHPIGERFLTMAVSRDGGHGMPFALRRAIPETKYRSFLNDQEFPLDDE